MTRPLWWQEVEDACAAVEERSAEAARLRALADEVTAVAEAQRVELTSAADGLRTVWSADRAPHGRISIVVMCRPRRDVHLQGQHLVPSKCIFACNTGPNSILVASLAST